MTSSLEWRGYQIKAGLVGGKPAAQVYLGLKRATAERFTGGSVEAAIEAARAWVDERLATQYAQRRADHVATAVEYADYLTAHGLRDHERLMLSALVEKKVMTATELAVAAGWTSYEPANLHFGWLGREVAQTLGLKVTLAKGTGNPVWTSALADDAGDPEAPHFQWRIHPELVDGLRLSGVLSRR